MPDQRLPAHSANKLEHSDTPSVAVQKDTSLTRSGYPCAATGPRQQSSFFWPENTPCKKPAALG